MAGNREVRKETVVEHAEGKNFLREVEQAMERSLSAAEASEKAESLSPIARKLKKKLEEVRQEQHVEWLKESSRRATLMPHVPRKVGKPEGIHWALTDPADIRTYAYAVREQCSRKSCRKIFIPERIPQSEEPMADGSVQRVFFLMNPSEGGNEVVLLRYHRREKNCQMISAFAQKQVLKVSDKSIWVEAQRGKDLPDEDGQ